MKQLTTRAIEPEVLAPEAPAKERDANYILRQMHRDHVRVRGYHSREARKHLSFLIHRSGGGCDACGYSFRPAIIPHHIRTLDHFGETHPMNLVALCQNCHAAIHYFLNDRVKEMAVKLTEALSLYSDEKARRLLILSTEQVFVQYDGSLVLRAEVNTEESVYQQQSLLLLGMEIPETKLSKYGREFLCQQPLVR